MISSLLALSSLPSRLVASWLSRISLFGDSEPENVKSAIVWASLSER